MSAVNPAILRDKAFVLELVGREEVDGQPADILKISDPKGSSWFTLSFDVATGLPVQRGGTYPGENGKELSYVTTFAGYVEVSGVKVARLLRSKAGDGSVVTRNRDVFLLRDTIGPGHFEAQIDRSATTPYVPKDKKPPARREGKGVTNQ